MKTMPEVTRANQSSASLNLAGVREAKGLTLDEIASTTLIGVHYLEAIEAEEFAKLPARVYAASYIRQYCRAVGYDETAVLARYSAQAESVPAEATPQRRPWLNWWPHKTLQSLLDQAGTTLSDSSS